MAMGEKYFLWLLFKNLGKKGKKGLAPKQLIWMYFLLEEF